MLSNSGLVDIKKIDSATEKEDDVLKTILQDLNNDQILGNTHIARYWVIHTTRKNKS